MRARTRTRTPLLPAATVLLVVLAATLLAPPSSSASHKVSANMNAYISDKEGSVFIVKVTLTGTSTKKCFTWDLTIRAQRSRSASEVRVGVNTRKEVFERYFLLLFPGATDSWTGEVRCNMSNGLDSASDTTNTITLEAPGKPPLPPPPPTPVNNEKDDLKKKSAEAAARQKAACGGEGESFGGCASSIIDVISSSTAEAIDPPDDGYSSIPEFQRVPRAKRLGPVCRKVKKRSTCKRIQRAARRYFDASARTASLLEIIAISTNRFQTARADLAAEGPSEFLDQALRLQLAVKKAYEGELVLALADQENLGKAFAKELKRGKVNFRRSGKALKRAERNLERLKGLPRSIIERLQEDNFDVRASIRHGLALSRSLRLPADYRKLIARSLPSSGFAAEHRSITVEELNALVEAIVGGAALSDETARHMGEQIKGVTEECDPGFRAGGFRRFMEDVGKYKGPNAALLRRAAEPLADNFPSERPAGCPPPYVPRPPYAGWGSFGFEAGEFDIPTDVTIAAGGVYVADQQNNRVQRFTPDGTFVGQWGSAPESGLGSDLQDGQFLSTVGVAVSPVTGDVYVADFFGNRVQQFTADGTFIRKWGNKAGEPTGTPGNADGELYRPGGIAVDASGDVYVVDIGNARIQKFTSTGNFITKWGSDGTADGQFQGPRGITTDPAGNVYVADRARNDVQVFSPAGAFIRRFGSGGLEDGQFNGAYDVAIDAAGNVWVADRESYRIQKFTPEGAFLAKEERFGDAGDYFKPIAVATDGSFNVYVADVYGRTEFDEVVAPGVGDRILVFGDRR